MRVSRGMDAAAFVRQRGGGAGNTKGVFYDN